ncbi:Bromodomain-containing factor 2 [Morus notabilis]|uniref:Bromodomain-containing factor 2 n=1 Tax=Morus notabilis TaxID=981085 RepID=W9QKA6_9ROSA|nr:bromodomain testis-specific protein [Morus notabilis]XP_024020553.1 bromodomain testis-specific protein [Morus notabilis]EXB29042.1 Bromodomain-containing factor 2 [Morus notabilis]
MKRKRGHKKGKSKGASATSAKVEIPSGDGVNLENVSGADDFDKNNKYDSGMEVDTPSSTGTDQPHNVANINPDGSIGKGSGKLLGRVKVKLRTPKIMESQVTSSDAPTQSDTDKSSHQMDLDRQEVVAEKVEDSANSLPESKMTAPESSSKKAGSIKIKSSKVPGSSSNQSIEAVATSDESPRQKEESPRQKEEKTPRQDSRYDKHELDTALMVIKKVMKMDAAEPFNVPVNPVALGIPDYFDVIDTPMDFGTICSNLESGVKYENSEDVFKDVQYIWDNCFKYNNKGDYILDLMRRVKKNFTKYWTAAGLYSGQPRGTNGVESSLEKVAPSGQIKVYVKGGQSKKSAKKFGRRHKSDCLCAICVLKRRRREREENARIAKSLEIGDNNPIQELNQEESSPAESPSGDNSTSNMEESSVDPNADAEVEQSKEVKMEESKQHCRPSENKGEEEVEQGEEEDVDDEDEGNEVEMKDKGNEETPEQFEKSMEDTNKESLQPPAEKSGDGLQSDTHKEDTVMQHEEGAVQRQKQKESQEAPQKVKARQIKLVENPMLLELCGTLFPDNNRKSIWGGPHSLVRRQSTSRTSSIHAAIDMLMK